jgi:hypothetical protein
MTLVRDAQIPMFCWFHAQMGSITWSLFYVDMKSWFLVSGNFMVGWRFRSIQNGNHIEKPWIFDDPIGDSSPMRVISGGWSPWVPCFSNSSATSNHCTIYFCACIPSMVDFYQSAILDFPTNFHGGFPSKIIQTCEKWRKMVASPSSPMLLLSPRPWSTSAAAWRSCWRPCGEERSAAPGLGDKVESMGMGQGRWPNDWML